MPLTREHALALAGLVVLAYGDAVPPGGTISQGAAAEAGAAAGLHHGSGGLKKVASAPGSAFFHKPIGALIIPHGKLHYAAGEPGHMIHGVSEAKWIANQWKDKDAAKGEAEKAVAAGTHHWVQSGGHTFAVHNGLEVHVPKDVDIHNPAAVKNAHKVVVKPGEHSEHVMLKPEGPGETQAHDAGAKHLLETGYKKLPPEPAKKAVTIGGKHAAWVPHDWQVYKAAGQPEGQLQGKWAKDAAGQWHFIGKSGEEEPKLHQADEWVKGGSLEPDTDHAGPELSHVAPNQGAEGHEPPKADVGGVAVTKDEIHAAIAHLNEDKSTAVKQPLAKKGHPLAAMDYHQVAADELAKHPELKIPKGTKKAHVGQVKVAVLHHLAAAAGKLAQDEAQAKAAEAAKDKAEAVAQHAQQLTPGTYEVGGVHVTAQEIAQAIAKLEGSKSTQIKGLLKGNPLAGSDYWSVVNDYKAAHPAEFGTGTKQAHVAKAKPLFVAALKDLSDQVATGDLKSGHDFSAAVSEALTQKYVKPGWEQSSSGAVVRALFMTAGLGHNRFVSLGPEPGVWIVSMFPPEGKAFYEVSPEQKVIFHLADGKVSHEWEPEQLAEAVQQWTADSPPPEPKAPEPELPEPEPAPKPVLDTAAWKATPEYQAVHDLVAGFPGGLPEHGNKLDTNQQLAAVLVLAGKIGQTRYLYPAKDGGWTASSVLPAGVAGTFGMPGKAYYEITKDHEIVAYGNDGQGTALPGETVEQLAKDWLTQPEPEPEPEKPAEPEPEPEPPKPEPPAGVEELKQLLINGAVKPSAEAGGKTNEDWVLVSAVARAAKAGTDRWVLKSGDAWVSYTYQPYDSSAEWYHVSADLAATHHVDGVDTPVPAAKVGALVHQLVVPDAVKIDVGGPYSHEYKIFKFGFYYKTSKTAKAYLEISPPEAPNHGAEYTYHAPSGTKKVNAKYAAKVLADATEYHAQPKGAPSASKKISYAAVATPGTYQLWSDIGHAPSGEHTAELHGDGSLLLHSPEGSVPLAADSSPQDSLLKGGALLDAYGTSLVKPGVVPEKYHVFGSEAKSAADLKALLDGLQAAYSDKAAVSALVQELVPAGHKEQALAFFSAKSVPVEWHAQRDAVMGLLRELLTVPEQKPGTEQVAGEVKYLKGLPPGISGPEDIFAWTEQGYAKPAEVTWPGHGLLYSTATDLGTLIKQVSEQYGGGKVVGTHPSALAKDAKLDWLQAWQAGDMAKVFAYDSAGGKVSPAHPGAPGNPGTHQVTWAPWDVSQVPASTTVAGDWSPLEVTPTKAEADNYLIKAGLTHAAFLSLVERRGWVKAHRSNDQLTVDTLSKTAADRFAFGAQALSEPPAWTEHVEPAKSYTVLEEDGTSASSWPIKAAEDFAGDHHGELLPFAQQLVAEQESSFTAEEWLSAGGYYARQAIARWQEDKAAKELAEKLRPKYELVPGEPGTVADQFGHQYLWHPGGGKAAKRRIAVADLARAWGMKTPRVQQVKLEADGTAGTITDLLTPDAGTLAYLPAGVASLSARELGDLAREHVFDFALANPSSTPGEYVRAGGSIVGTGKAGAFSDLGWQGADLAHLNDVTTQPVSALFDAIASGDLPQGQADAAYIAAVRAARRMAQLPSSRLAAILNAAGLDMNAQVAMFGRVDALPGTIQKLWDDAYTARGWLPPEVPAAKLPHGLHAGFSEPEFFDHVMAAKASGVPAFFAGPQLEDGSFLVWTEKAGGNRYLRGESGLRGDALGAAVKWAQQHVTGGEPQPKPVPEPAAGVKNTAAWYAKIIGAAKAVSLHAADQNFEGAWTKQKLTDLEALKTELTQTVMFAEAVQDGHDPDAAGFASAHGDPAMVKQAAQYYLAKIDQVEQAKANAGTFKPGDIPDWEPPPAPEPEAPPAPEPALGGVKVEYLKATRVLAKAQHGQHSGPSGDIVDEQGELQLGSGIYEYPGYAWHVTLPTGEVIELNDETTTSTPTGQHGRVRFRAIASDGSASLERIRTQLQEMGVPLEEASPADMELLYWRHLAGVLANRADRAEGKHAAVWASLGTAVPAAAKVSGEEAKVGKVVAAGLDPGKEAEVWRSAWANLTSTQQVQDWVDKGGYLPHLPHLNTATGDVPSGKPYWYRFDADPAWLAKRQLVAHSLSDPSSAPYHIATTGGLYSTEGRLRALGTWISGASSSTDMQSHGSAGFVYTRLNQETGHGKHVLISPRVLARTSTYGFSSDNYGDIGKRKTGAYFDLAKAAAHDGGSNETEIKDVVSLLDDVMLLNAGPSRGKVLEALKARGITEIRGLPVEDRIVNGITADAVAKVKAAEPAPETWFAHPEEPWSPPQAESVSKAQSVVESEAEKAHSVAATPEDALANALYSADHSAAAAPEEVSQVFYHAPGKPATVMSEAPKLKGEAAQRVAGKMSSSEEAMVALADAAGLNAPESWGPDARTRIAAALVASWAQSNSSAVALALQNVAHDLFGVKKEALPGLGFTSASDEAAAKALESGYGAVLADFLAAQWAETQAELSSGGVQQLTLYRVFHFSSVPEWAKNIAVGQVIDAPQARPLSSWGFLQSAAEAAGTFAAGGETVVVKVTVPAEMALSFPRTGFGCYNESEFVILDAPGQWEIVKVSGG